MIDEYGWLIEYNRFGTITWWNGDYIDTGGNTQWTINSLEAVRFSRKVDAEMVMVGVLGFKLPCANFYAVEHNWYSK